MKEREKRLREAATMIERCRLRPSEKKREKEDLATKSRAAGRQERADCQFSFHQ